MTAPHPGWARAAWIWSAFVALVLLSMAPSAVSMVDIWWNIGTYNHAFAVPVIVGWLAWSRRSVWLPLEPRADVRWWPLLVLASLLVVVSEAALANAPSHAGLVAVLVLSVPSLLGTAVARALMFPLAYAFFMVPVGDFLLPSMMEATATATVWALRATGIPVYREGLMFVIPSGNWSVVEACSGVRYLIASLSVGTLYGYISYRSWQKRLAFIALAVLVPIVANWARAYGIVMLGHLSDNRLATGADHLVYGWVFFGVVMALLFMIGGRWVDDHDDHWKRAGTPPQATAKPISTPAPSASPRLVPASVLCALLACAPAIGSAWLQRQAQQMPPRALPTLSPTASGPEREAVEALDWRPRFLHANAEDSGLYRLEGGSVPIGLYQAEYRQQDRSRKLLSSENTLVASGDERWRSLPARGVTVRAQGPHGLLEIKPQIVQSIGPGSAGGPTRRLVVQLVQVDGRWSEPSSDARLRLAWARLQGRSDQSRAWVVHTEVEPVTAAVDEPQAMTAAAQRLSDFTTRALAASSP